MSNAAYQLQWRKKNKEKDKAYMAAWRAANTERIEISRKARYERTKEQQKKKAISWQKRNPEKFILICKASSANKKYPGKIGYNDILKILDRDGMTCYRCKTPIDSIADLSLEHLRPINEIQHLTVVHKKCNCARLHLRNGRRPYKIQFTDAELEEFLRWLKEKNITAEIKRYYSVSNIKRTNEPS